MNSRSGVHSSGYNIAPQWAVNGFAIGNSKNWCGAVLIGIRHHIVSAL